MAITVTKQEKDWWDELPEKVQAEIEEAMAESDNGGGMPHDEVMKKYPELFTR